MTYSAVSQSRMSLDLPAKDDPSLSSKLSPTGFPLPPSGSGNTPKSDRSFPNSAIDLSEQVSDLLGKSSGDLLETSTFTTPSPSNENSSLVLGLESLKEDFFRLLTNTPLSDAQLSSSDFSDHIHAINGMFDLVQRDVQKNNSFFLFDSTEDLKMLADFCRGFLLDITPASNVPQRLAIQNFSKKASILVTQFQEERENNKLLLYYASLASNTQQESTAYEEMKGTQIVDLTKDLEESRTTLENQDKTIKDLTLKIKFLQHREKHGFLQHKPKPTRNQGVNCNLFFVCTACVAALIAMAVFKYISPGNPAPPLIPRAKPNSPWHII